MLKIFELSVLISADSRNCPSEQFLDAKDKREHKAA
jgi:hypothetical protein